MTELNVFVPINKVDVAQRLVYGQLAAEVPDHSGEIMDYETSAPNWKAWSDEIHKATDGRSAGNVRSMHTNIAAGKLTDITFDDVNKQIIGCAKIVDDNEWNKVLEGVYTGFSMGGKYVKRWACPENPALKRYTASVHEVSLVDAPCIPTAMFFDVVKADGTTELRKFKVVKDADAALKQVWQATDGTTFEKKADALAKSVALLIEPAAETEPAEAEPTEAEKAIAALAEAEAALKAKEVSTEVSTDADKAAAFKAAVTKALVAKQLCDIPQLVDVISNLQWLQSGLEWDTLFDDANTSTLPADLKAILSSLCDFLKAMVEDATADITADKVAFTAEQVDALRKVTGQAELLKDYSAPEPQNEPLETLRTESAAQIGKITQDLDIEKAAKADLEKTLGTVTAGVADLLKRIEHLEAQPAPAKGVKGPITVLKGHEGSASGAKVSDADLALKFSHLPPEQARAEIAKFKQSQTET